MKIALVTTTFLPKIGGAEFVVHHLAQHWSRQGHKVCVINRVSDEPTQPGAEYSVRKFYFLRGSGRFGHHRFPFLWHSVRTLGRMLEEYQPDFISAHFGYPTAICLSRIKPVPKFLITCHGVVLNKIDGPRVSFNIDELLADAMNKSAGAVAISNWTRKNLEELGVLPYKIIDIPNGVNTGEFKKKVTFDLRKKFNIPGNATVILAVGREHWSKAFDTGIKAFAKVQARLPETYYVILGKRTERWRPLAEELGVGGHVIFSQLLGDELIGAYQQADVFFSSSISELCPLVVIEAMAASRPAVVTNVSGSQDMITTGYNGLVVEPGRPDCMANALYELITDKTLRRRFSANTLERSKLYDWDTISRRYLEHA